MLASIEAAALLAVFAGAAIRFMQWDVRIGITDLAITWSGHTLS
ncbi:MAG: hypothetical protein P0107_06970 [Nitrosomonas sp.]|nr:hypothetical protein [Nitrosomonas sp.]